MPGGSRPGNAPGRNRSRDLLRLVLEAENDLRDLAVGRGQDQAFAGFGRKIMGERELPGRRGKPVADRIPGGLGRESDGDGGGGRRGLEHGMAWSLGLARLGWTTYRHRLPGF